MNLFGLGLVLEFTDKASAGLLNVNRIFGQSRASAEELTQAIDKSTKAYAALGGIGLSLSMAGSGITAVGDKIIEPLKKGYEASKDFQREMTMVGVVTGESGAELEKLRKIAIQTGIDTAFSATETAQALYQLKSAGLSTEASVRSLKDTLNLVTMSGGEITLEEGAELMVQTMNKFNLASTESARIADMWGVLSKDTMFKMNEFQAFVNSLGSAPATLQRPMEELLGMGGMLRNIGQQAAQAGNTVQGFGRKLLMLTAQMSKGTMKGQKANALKLIGLDKDTIWDAEGNMKSMTEIFATLIKNTANLTQEQKATAFQTVFADQAKNMITAVELGTKAYMKYDEATGKYVVSNEKGKQSLDDLVKSLGSAKGMAEEATDAFLATSWGIDKLYEGSVETFQIMIGDTVAPIINKLVSGLTWLLNKLLAVGEAHPIIMKVFGWGMGLAGLLTIGAGVAVIFTGAIIMLGSGLMLAAGQAAKFAVAQGLVTDATLAANGGILSGSMLLGVYKTQLMSVVGGIRGAVVPALQTMMYTFLRLFAVVGLMYLIWRTDFLHLRTTVTGWVNHVKSSFADAKKIMGMNSTDMLKEIRKLEQSESTWDKLTVWMVKLGVLWEGICDAWGDNTLSEESFIKLRELGLLPTVEALLDFKMIAEAVWQGVKEGFTGMSDVAVGAVQWVITKFQEFGDWLDKIVGKTEPVKTEMKGVADATKALNLDGWREFGKITGGVVAALLMVKIGTVIWGIGTAIASVLVPALGLLTTAIGFVAGAFGTLATALLFNPITWIILGVIALAAALWWIVKNWDKVKAALVAGLTWLGEMFTGIGRTIADAFMSVWTPVADFFTGLWNGIVDVARTIWNIIVEVVMIVAKTVWSLWKAEIDGIVAIWNWLVGIAQTVWNGICSVVTGVVDSIKTVWAGIGTFFSGLWDGIKSSAKELFDWLAGKFKWVTDTISSVKGWFSSNDGNVREGKEPSPAPKVQMATGGFVKSQGVAMLDPNEVVINDPLTKKLNAFLTASPRTGGAGSQDIQQDNRVVFEKGSIEIVSTGNTEVDVDALVKKIEPKLRRMQQIRTMAGYQTV